MSFFVKMKTALNAFQDAFQDAASAYWDELNKSDEVRKGERFEKWVVKMSNIHIEYFENKKDHKSSCDKMIVDGYWRLIEWRGDKSSYRIVPKSHEKKTVIAESSTAPDLTLKCRGKKYNVFSKWEEGSIIFVECKWRSKPYTSLKKSQIRNYYNYIREYIEERIEGARKGCVLYYVFGFGWDDTNDRPSEVYTIEADKLYRNLEENPSSYPDRVCGNTEPFYPADLMKWGATKLDFNAQHDEYIKYYYSDKGD